MDFSLWENIQKRMDESAPKGRESVDAFKKRLRKAALSTPRAEVRKMSENMKKKAQQIYDAQGGNIPSD